MIKSQVLAVKSKLNEKLSTLQEVNNEVLRLVKKKKADDFEIEIEEVIINIDSTISKPGTPPVIHPFILPVVPPHHIKATV